MLSKKGCFLGLQRFALYAASFIPVTQQHHSHLLILQHLSHAGQCFVMQVGATKTLRAGCYKAPNNSLIEVDDSSLPLSTMPQTVKILPAKFTPCPSFSSNKKQVSQYSSQTQLQQLAQTLNTAQGHIHTMLCMSLGTQQNAQVITDQPE